MSIKIINRTLGLFTISLSVSLAAWSMESHGLRGKRYCEVVLSEGLFKFAVYNSQSLNDCPQDKWQNLSTTKIRANTKSLFVKLNGPRYWAFDSIEYTPLIKRTEKDFQGIKMKKIAYVNINPMTLITGAQGYKVHKVDRNTTFIYTVGKPIYELISPSGDVYVMQSYSVEKAKISESDLANLKNKLKLPDGWKFKTGIAKKTEYLTTTNNEAYVLQDDLLNSYQRAPHELLP